MTEIFAPQRVNQLHEVTGSAPTWLAIGVFDGVHRGHQRLLNEMVRAARRAGGRPAVLTFYPHPKEVIQGISGRLYLTTLEERVALLGALGIELIITQQFTEEVRRTHAREFVEQLHQHLALRELWGGQFSLGLGRQGDAAFLTELGKEMGFTVHQLNYLDTWDGEDVSSSRIRYALAAGNIGDVNGCMGRRFSLGGAIMRGDQRGRKIGFPTANLDVWEQQLLPGKGVYATYAWLGEERFQAATNVGVRPTVDGEHLSVEAHLLDFDRDIYGEWLRLEFVERVRDEQKFPGLDALKAQIAADVRTVRNILEGL
jgi:riboflavin kinase/FMN adenylyltransferase